MPNEDRNGVFTLSAPFSRYLTAESTARNIIGQRKAEQEQAKRKNYIRLAVTGLGFLGVGVVAYKLGQSSGK